ncbi:MAG: aspartyl-phosphate phosphatase Spo0E family protein [Clostridiales bacterium]|nr:aspartyl-phosphate phosphatase Spo0E family protein [Clostridiales bacterium]MCD8110530.1 aspartyl-phosphate phosphatase Spo0E family protein [Clostridiales bacterium]MCD8133702.1 aspartyl-phosphate phosphatase Spo0E family protein [Clostridiales bacterium]
MGTKEALLQKIRQEQERLNELAKDGLDQPEVIEQSRKVDRLLEEYYRIQDKTE